MPHFLCLSILCFPANNFIATASMLLIIILAKSPLSIWSFILVKTVAHIKSTVLDVIVLLKLIE